jgi:hypothetical protein
MAFVRSRASQVLGRRPPLFLGGAGQVFGLGALPAGFTMGDPTTADYGSAYYNGYKVAGHQVRPINGQNVDVWVLDDSNGNILSSPVGPPYDPAVEDEITAAANAAYPTYRQAQLIATATPEMRAILTDPEWTGLATTHPGGFSWGDLSAELQAKIIAVPNLEANIPGSPTFSAAAQANPAPPPAAPTGPSYYTSNGLTVDANGVPLSYTDPRYYNALLDEFQQDLANGATRGVVTAAEGRMAIANPLLVSSLPPDFLRDYGASLQAFLHPSAAPAQQSSGATAPPGQTTTPATPASPPTSSGATSDGTASGTATTPPALPTGGGLQVPGTFATPGGGLSAPVSPAGTGSDVSLATLGGGSDTLLLVAAGAAALLLFLKNRR